jgi:F0F1-type ATP synthase membrane subunit c/vacuolar-type H+-ATPase subunit K
MTIEEKSKNNNINTQMIVIVALLVVIAIMGFFLGKNTVNSPSTNTTNT